MFILAFEIIYDELNIIVVVIVSLHQFFAKLGDNVYRA